ncbi:uncharacterized protein METZ01_LOCUS393746, partial [marine metagenome]
MKINRPIVFVYFCIVFNWVSAAEMDSSFSVKWHNDSWLDDGLFPAGPPWNMVGPYDFDNDGYEDFVVASAYAGA